MFYQGGTEVEELKGYVDHIIFRNPDNGYTVFVMVCDEELTCVGTFSMLSEGENIRDVYKRQI